MTYFGILAFILIALAVGFFIPILITFIQTGLVPNFPTLIVCGFSAIAGIQAFFAGLILKTMVHKNRQDFEARLIDIENEKKRLMS